ncbi:hypothetical protein ACFLU6_14505 [Acidobacteriota bacterium]
MEEKGDRNGKKGGKGSEENRSGSTGSGRGFSQSKPETSLVKPPPPIPVSPSDSERVVTLDLPPLTRKIAESSPYEKREQDKVPSQATADSTVRAKDRTKDRSTLAPRQHLPNWILGLFGEPE